MKKTIILAYLALILSFLLPFAAIKRDDPPLLENKPQKESGETAPQADEIIPEETVKNDKPVIPVPEKVRVLDGENVILMDMQDYITGVLAAEMPADFGPEALKAQAVAARSFALYCKNSHKHKNADLCTDYNCCQAYISEDEMKKNWGESFEDNYKKISSAVKETEGEYLSYEGQAVFAAFHSASDGYTESCGEIWSELPYLVSVESPENEKTVPNFISTLECAPIDFRDCILSAFPEADFTAEEALWIGDSERDESGRIRYISLGGVRIKGTELRKLFSLRSTAFSLEYTEGKFLFTVRGFGHGVGMSQYGAKLLAQRGLSYKTILAHYYPGTSLIS